MAIPKIVLFYVFAPLPDPEALRLWQQTLCESLGLTGRIILSPDGINATVGGELANVKLYLRATRSYAPFAALDAKWSEGTGDDFPKLSVKVRDELVSFGAPDAVRVDDTGVIGGGTKLSPDELHDLVARDNVTFFDGRNRIEAQIGMFTDAVVPDVANTREFVAELDSGRYDHLKQQPVVTYCTGGIRCEVLSALMIDRGFEQVYQLDGGIARYGERFGDTGLWQGSLYVFDKRESIRFTDAAATVGRCHECGTPTYRTVNCADASCRELFVVCDEHADIRCAAHSLEVNPSVGSDVSDAPARVGS